MPLHNTNSSSRRPRPPSKAKPRDGPPTTQSAIPTKILKTPGLVTLDGRTLEGGGQLVRVALTLSALLSIPVYIHHIRGKRAARGQSGGLKESHLAALEFLQEACGAEVYGAEVGATEVVFLPGKGNVVVKKDGEVHVIELKNPGSVWLIFQAIYPFVLFRRRRGSEKDESKGLVKLKMRGGTNVSMSMSAEYVQQVFLPSMEKIGLPKTAVEIGRRGWTHGRVEVGEVEINVTPLSFGQRLEGFSIRDTNAARDGTPVKKITVSAMASPTAVLEYLVVTTQQKVRATFPDLGDVEVLVKEDSGDPRRMYVLLVAQLDSGWRIGRDWLFDGKLKNNGAMVIAEQMAEKVVADLSAEIKSGGCVDEFMQDQLVIFQALATGKSEVDAGIGRGEGSEHTRTVKWVVEQMLGKEMFAGGMVDGCGLLVGPDCSAHSAQEEADVLHDQLREISLEG